MSAPVKKCEVCDSTGSKSREIGGDLDCVACTAADNRAAMRNKLGPMTYTEELYAWRAYQLGKAAAAPVATRNVLAVELLAALDALQVGCIDKTWYGWQNGDGEEVGTRLQNAIDAYRAAPVVPVAAQPVVPEGWRVVPIRPTHEMVRAACDAMGATQSVMLAIEKAPLPPFVGALKFDPAKLNQLIHDFGNASFEIGEWKEGDEGETIYQIHARCDAAKAALVQHICSLAAPSLEAQPAEEVERDAKRWRQMLLHVGADQSPAMGIQYFVFRGIHAKPGVNLMRGSVAEHFTDVIDASMAQGEKHERKS